jgi:hypothetical protein
MNTAKRKGRQNASPVALSTVTAKVATTVTTPSATAAAEVQTDTRSVTVPIVVVVVVRCITVTVPSPADDVTMAVPATSVIDVVDGRRFGGRLQPTNRHRGAGWNCETAKH